MQWKWLVLVATVAGCGSPYPHERVVSSAAAIRAASEVDAASDPRAAARLLQAQRQRAEAERLLSQGDNRAAESLLIRAEADANLAAAEAREAPLVRDAERARSRVEAVRAKSRL